MLVEILFSSMIPQAKPQGKASLGRARAAHCRSARRGLKFEIALRAWNPNCRQRRRFYAK